MGKRTGKEILLSALKDAAADVFSELKREALKEGFELGPRDIFAGQAVASMLWEKLGFGPRIVNDVDVFRIVYQGNFNDPEEIGIGNNSVCISISGYGDVYVDPSTPSSILLTQRQGKLNIIHVYVDGAAPYHLRNVGFQRLIELFDLNSVQAGISSSGELYITDRFIDFLMNRELEIVGLHSPSRTSARKLRKEAEYRSAGLTFYSKRDLRPHAVYFLTEKLSKTMFFGYNRLLSMAKSEKENVNLLMEAQPLGKVRDAVKWVESQERFVWMTEKYGIPELDLGKAVAMKDVLSGLNGDFCIDTFRSLCFFGVPGETSLETALEKGRIPFGYLVKAQEFIIRLSSSYIHPQAGLTAPETLDEDMKELGKFEEFLTEKRVVVSYTEREKEKIENEICRILEEAESSAFYSEIVRLDERLSGFFTAMPKLIRAIMEEDAEKLVHCIEDVYRTPLHRIVVFLSSLKYISRNKAKKIADMLESLKNNGKLARLIFQKAVMESDARKMVDFRLVAEGLEIMTHGYMSNFFPSQIDLSGIERYALSFREMSEKVAHLLGISKKEAKNILLGIVESGVPVPMDIKPLEKTLIRPDEILTILTHNVEGELEKMQSLILKKIADMQKKRSVNVLLERRLEKRVGERTVFIEQILSQIDLVREGNEMSHCVGGYGIDSENNAFFSVWIDEKRKKTRFTARLYRIRENDLETWTVGEIRGFANRSLSVDEAKMIAEAFREFLDISDYEFLQFSDMRKNVSGEAHVSLLAQKAAFERVGREVVELPKRNEAGLVPEIPGPNDEDWLPF